MEKGEYAKLYRIEEKNWYYSGRRELFFDLIKRYKPAGRLKILDVGAGTGTTLKMLGRLGEAVGIDFSDEAVRFCRKRGVKCIKGDAANMPFKKEEFDLMTCFSLIEHTKDDEKVLREIYRVCKKGGKLVLECPAFNFLWSPHDEAFHHYRRYSKSELKNKLEKAGFKIEKISYAIMFVFPIVLVFRSFKRLKKFIAPGKRVDSDPMEKIPAAAGNILKFFLKIETMLLRRINFPFGVSVICVARK